MSKAINDITDQLRAVLALNEIETYEIDNFDNRKLTFVTLARTSIDKNEIDILKQYGFETRSIMLSHFESIKYHWDQCMQLLIRANDLIEVESIIE